MIFFLSFSADIENVPQNQKKMSTIFRNMFLTSFFHLWIGLDERVNDWGSINLIL